MNFLMPAAWGLLALALPVIGFYLLKSRQRRRRVSTLLFWDQLPPRIENTPFWRKLRRWLSLVAQLLILCVVVAALARPGFVWERAAPRQVVLVLDTSPGMGASDVRPSRLSKALDFARDEIARLRVHDEAAIVATESHPVLIHGWTSSRQALRNSLEEVALATHPHGNQTTLQLAGALAAMRSNAEVRFFTGGVWDDDAVPDGINIVQVGSDEPQNTGISRFAVRRSTSVPGGWQLDVEVTGAGEAWDGRLVVHRDSAVLDAIEVKGSAGEVVRRSWRGHSLQSHTFQATLEVGAADALASDNHASVDLAELKPVRVSVGGAPDPFLDAALESLPIVESRRIADVNEAGNGLEDLIILRRTGMPDAPLAVPVVMIGPESSGFWGEYQGSLKNVLVTEIAKDHAAVRHTNFARVGIAEAGNWQAPEGTDVLVASLGNPLIFGNWGNAPSWLVVGFEPEASDFVLRTAFPVFLANVIESLRDAGEAGRQVAILPGAVQSRLAAAGEGEGHVENEVSRSPNFPGWWMALVLAVGFLVGEWFLFTRRILE